MYYSLLSLVQILGYYYLYRPVQSLAWENGYRLVYSTADAKGDFR